MIVEKDNYGYKFYREILNSPKLILGPMVDQSEFAFRELCRKYGSDLCYTPMMHAGVFIKNPKYRDENLFSCSSDRPLIAQFCCNDPEIFLEACKLSKNYCNAIDINLGCPQGIAKRGHYGSFLQDEWEIISSMIKIVKDNLDIPITCKIRVFDDEEKTLKYAKMIENAGCYILTVHGRTREMKGQFTGIADWKIIKKIKENLKIPVFANGNIQSMEDVKNCFDFTKVDGIMSAEGLLYNPVLYKSLHMPSWILIDEYLEIVKKYQCPNSFIRGHLFKMAHTTLLLPENKELRDFLAKANSLDKFQLFSTNLRKKYEKDENQIIEMTTLPLPHYLTQPYFRPKIKQLDLKHKLEDLTDELLEKKKRRLAKKESKTKQVSNKKIYSNCSLCSNPKSETCQHSLCKPCCKKKCYIKSEYFCEAHKFNLTFKKS